MLVKSAPLLLLIVFSLSPPNLGLISHCRPLGPPHTRPRSGGVWTRGVPGVAPTALRCADADASVGDVADAARSTRLKRDLKQELARTESELEKLNARVRALELEKAEKLQELKAVDAGHTSWLDDRAEAEEGSASAPLRPSDSTRTGTLKSREPSWWHPQQLQEWLGARPIGTVMTSFPEKNGTPRQGSVAPASKARLEIGFGNNPQHSVEGLSDFSHVWLLFLFHHNGPHTPPKAKVRPPRLGGATKGVFATRAPHRPNPIGLSLCKLDRVTGNVLELSGVDLVDGTPILDVKPFIPSYDVPDSETVRFPKWCIPEAHTLIQVSLSPASTKDLRDLELSGQRPRLALTWQDAIQGLSQILAADPRSVYRRQKCAGEVYPVCFDRLNAWCLFDDTHGTVSIQRLFLAEAGVRLPDGAHPQDKNHQE